MIRAFLGLGGLMSSSSNAMTCLTRRLLPGLHSAASSGAVAAAPAGPWAGVGVQSVRTVVRKHYQPSIWKRVTKHSIEKRLSTPSGKEVLWRRMLKGRHNLAVFERILPRTVNTKILPPHQHKYKNLITRDPMSKPKFRNRPLR